MTVPLNVYLPSISEAVGERAEIVGAGRGAAWVVGVLFFFLKTWASDASCLSERDGVSDLAGARGKHAAAAAGVRYVADSDVASGARGRCQAFRVVGARRGDRGTAADWGGTRANVLEDEPKRKKTPSWIDTLVESGKTSGEPSRSVGRAPTTARRPIATRRTGSATLSPGQQHEQHEKRVVVTRGESAQTRGQRVHHRLERRRLDYQRQRHQEIEHGHASSTHAGGRRPARPRAERRGCRRTLDPERGVEPITAPEADVVRVDVLVVQRIVRRELSLRVRLPGTAARTRVTASTRAAAVARHRVSPGSGAPVRRACSHLAASGSRNSAGKMRARTA